MSKPCPDCKSREKDAMPRPHDPHQHWCPEHGIWECKAAPGNRPCKWGAIEQEKRGAPTEIICPACYDREMAEIAQRRSKKHD